MAAYTAAKQRILDFQGKDDIAILNREDPGAYGLKAVVMGRLVTFGFTNPICPVLSWMEIRSRSMMGKYPKPFPAGAQSNCAGSITC